MLRLLRQPGGCEGCQYHVPRAKPPKAIGPISAIVGREPFSELARRPEHCSQHDAHKSDDQSHDPTRHIGRDEDRAEKYSQAHNPGRRHQPHENRLDLKPSPLPPGEHRSIRSNRLSHGGHLPILERNDPWHSLRQPGGFEGLGVGEVVPYPNHASILQLPDHADIQLDRNAAHFPDSRLVRERDNSVMPDIDQALGLNRPVLEFPGPSAELLEEALPAAPDQSIGERFRHDPLEIISDASRIEWGAGIAALQSREPLPDQSPHQLDVLLRHRLLRQPGGFERIRSIVIPGHPHDLPVPECPDGCGAVFYVRATPLRAATTVGDDHHRVACVDELLGLQGVSLPWLEKLPGSGFDSLGATEDL